MLDCFTNIALGYVTLIKLDVLSRNNNNAHNNNNNNHKKMYVCAVETETHLHKSLYTPLLWLNSRPKKTTKRTGTVYEKVVAMYALPRKMNARLNFV